MYKKILVPIDGSQQSDKAEAKALELAKLVGAQVTFVHVMVPPTQFVAFSGEGPLTIPQEFMDEWKQMGQKLVDARVKNAAESTVKINGQLYMGNPPDKICQLAAEGGYDLIVIGSRGLGAIKGYLLGSVSDRVSHHAKCSVLIIH
ncbi:MAG TPA: universal stress protein [Verrucomicrobiae bacterium]|nr:universal stress protein [Verrucomicrobiae bacterium]